MEKGLFGSDRFYIYIYALFALLGTILRVVWAFEPSCFLDEALSWVLATNLSEALISTQPPLYPLLLSAWINIFGDSLFAVRLLAVSIGGVTIFLAGVFGKRIAGNTFGLITSMLLSVSPLMVFINATSGHFTFLIFLMLMAYYLLLLLLDQGRPDPLIAALLTGVLVLGIFTHFYFLTLFPLMIIYLVFFRKIPKEDGFPKTLFTIFALPAGAMVLYSPVAFSQIMLYLKREGLFVTSFRFPRPEIIRWFEDTTLAAPLDIPEVVTPIILFCALALAGYGTFLAVIKKKNVDPIIHLLFTGILVITSLFSMIIPVISEHLVWILLPGIIFLMSLGIMGFEKFRWIFALALALLGLAATMWHIFGIYSGGYWWKQNPDWKGLVRDVGVELAMDDQIVIQPSYYSAPFSFHCQKDKEIIAKSGPGLHISFISSDTDIGEERIHVPENINRVLFVCGPVTNCADSITELKNKGFELSRINHYKGATLSKLVLKVKSGESEVAKTEDDLN